MKKKKLITIGLLACLFLSGCGNAIPELTEEQQNMVTEYAVGTVLKYSANYEDKIICKELKKTEVAETEEAEQNQPQENTEAESDTADVPTVSVNEIVDAPALSVNETASAMSINSFLGLEGFSVEFQGSEVCDAYSGAEEEAVAFELQAGEGKKLLVLKYAVTNTTSQEQNFDLLSKNVKAKISVAGSNRSALLTMLENDFLHADTVIGANETGTFVILTEINEETEVGTIGLTLTCDGEKAKYTY